MKTSTIETLSNFIRIRFTKLLKLTKVVTTLITKQAHKKNILLNLNKRTELVALFLALLLFPILHGSLRTQKSQ